MNHLRTLVLALLLAWLAHPAHACATATISLERPGWFVQDRVELYQFGQGWYLFGPTGQTRVKADLLAELEAIGLFRLRSGLRGDPLVVVTGRGRFEVTAEGATPTAAEAEVLAKACRRIREVGLVRD